MTTVKDEASNKIEVPEMELTPGMIGKMLGGFGILGVSSTLLGLGFGLLTSFILKITPKMN